MTSDLVVADPTQTPDLTEMPSDDVSRRRALQLLGAGAGAVAAAPALSWADAASAGPVPPQVMHVLPIDRAYDGPTRFNILYDGKFRNWHAGTARGLPFENGNSPGYNFCGLWIGAPRLLPGGTLPQNAAAFKHDATEGGLRLRIVNAGAIYIRQRLPGVLQFSGKVLTLSVDVETDTRIKFDLYAQCRYNAPYPGRPSGDRILCIDTPDVWLDPGRHRLFCTFTVPTLDPNAFRLDQRNCLELAIRPLVQNGTPGANVIIREAILTPGRQTFTEFLQDDNRELTRLRGYFETGGVNQRGLPSTPTDKLVRVPFRTRKWRPGGAGKLVTTDLLGNRERITLYAPNGAAVHNIQPLKQGINSYRDGFNILVRRTRATGMAFRWVYEDF